MTTPNGTTIKALKGLEVPGLVTHDLTFQSLATEIDPFLIVSLFDMTGPVFPPHPHAGFSVATYIFPESEIGFWNQDTLGNTNEITPGSLHWTIAGAGLMHEETVTRAGKSALGFQIWIDHAASDREVKPGALHIAATDVPSETKDGVTRSVLIGRSGALSSQLRPPVAVRLIDYALEINAVLNEPLLASEQAFLWVRDGALLIGDKTIKAGEIALLGANDLIASALGFTRATLFAGVPFKQVTLPGGPFVGNDAAQLRDFRSRFQNGSMGHLTAFNQQALDHAYDHKALARGQKSVGVA